MNQVGRMVDYEFLKKHKNSGPWAERILSELGFLLEMSYCQNCALDAQVLPQIKKLRQFFEENGAITKDITVSIENELNDLSAATKAYDVTCVAHAHIDMNWMWGFHETAGLTIDTFRTMLQLMKEYPDFTFSQSQASVYRIVEEYAPEMLDEIRQRVTEGRWELTASTWVENDKNMSSGEAMARHILYTKNYLSKLFDIPKDSLQIDFEPDTFGHPNVMPEVLQQGGVNYYYHCRGNSGKCIYNWKAPSGATVLVYREPAWYNQIITPDLFLPVPSFCKEYGVSCYLKVYGVGDHGGGPTRRDVDKLIQMSGWPLFPTIHFGTLKSFFEKLDSRREQFETVDAELNYVFTGCYTSQARIKRANRIGESRMLESEALDCMAAELCRNYRTASDVESAWRRILFNQFHDILPGSGMTETREFAMGEFQRAMATAGINATHAMQALGNEIDTSSIFLPTEPDFAFGGGTGYALADKDGIRFPSAERGSGNKRLMTVWNPCGFARNDVFEITVWDWPSLPSRIKAELPDGTPVPLQVLDEGTVYWDHRYIRLAVQMDIPAFGWSSVVLSERIPEREEIEPRLDPRVDDITDEPVILENSKLRAAFSPNTMQLISLVRKEDEYEFIDPKHPGCSLRYITEASAEMRAWRVGRYATEENLSVDGAVSIDYVKKGMLRQEIGFHLPFHSSKVNAVVSLDEASTHIKFKLNVDWREFGTDSYIPQLNFTVPLAHPSNVSRCATPFGFIDRAAIAQDVPCTGLIAVEQNNGAIALISDCKYGFRNDGQALSLSLIRASNEPDPTPDIGMHTLNVYLSVTEWARETLEAEHALTEHPIYTTANTSHAGVLALAGSLITVNGAATLVAVKRAENKRGMVLRLFNPTPATSHVQIDFAKHIVEAAYVSILEEMLSENVKVEGKSLSLEIPAESLRSIYVELQ